MKIKYISVCTHGTCLESVRSLKNNKISFQSLSNSPEEEIHNLQDKKLKLTDYKIYMISEAQFNRLSELID